MGTIKDEALGYEPTSKIKNISELNAIDTNLSVFEDKEAEFPYKYIEVNGERYRLPASVISALNAILDENKDLKKFKVKKTGEGMDTKYTVIPLA